MKSGSFVGLATAFVLVATQAQADSKQAASDFVKCDGAPASVSGAKAAAMILAITATGCLVGCLVGAPETGDVDKRLKGAEGITACDNALATETNERRRAQLVLARAIHDLEAKDYGAAISDARRMNREAGAEGDTPSFRQSMGLSALEIEAAGLAADGRPAEAEATALRMAEIAPYDLQNLVRAQPYVGLTEGMGPAKAAYFERFNRLWPQALTWSGEAREWGGDFAGAAADHAALIEIAEGFIIDDRKASPVWMAQQAVDLALAGDTEGSAQAAARARDGVDELMRNGEQVRRQAEVAKAEELLDFQAIALQAARGRPADARAAFAARSRWLAPSPPAVAQVAAALREGAPASALTGALARDPTAIRNEALRTRLAALTEDIDRSKKLFAAIRYRPPSTFKGLSGVAWRTDKSRLRVKPKPTDTYRGDLLYVPPFQATSGVSELLVLHAALLAKADGKSGFVLSPARNKLDWMLVRYGDPGERGFPRRASFAADTVIADLSAEMPNPKP